MTRKGRTEAQQKQFEAGFEAACTLILGELSDAENDAFHEAQSCAREKLQVLMDYVGAVAIPGPEEYVND